MRQLFNLIELPAGYVEKFNAKFSMGNIDTCWEWEGPYNKSGYGCFSIGTPPFRVKYIASRVAYYLYFGIDPADNLVCHKCDNPPCVNPHHLFLGSYSDNNQDAFNKKRKVSPAKSRFLSEHPTSIFVQDDPYWEIWALWREGVAISSLAEAYDISYHAARNIVHTVEVRLEEMKLSYQHKET